MNLTSMNGERRLRLSEKYIDRYGNSLPDCLIAAKLAQNMERVLRDMGEDAYLIALALAHFASRKRAVEYGWRGVGRNAAPAPGEMADRSDDGSAPTRAWWRPPLGVGLKGGIL